MYKKFVRLPTFMNKILSRTGVYDSANSASEAFNASRISRPLQTYSWYLQKSPNLPDTTPRSL